jgi:hypothetical protein
MLNDSFSNLVAPDRPAQLDHELCRGGRQLSYLRRKPPIPGSNPDRLIGRSRPRQVAQISAPSRHGQDQSGTFSRFSGRETPRYPVRRGSRGLRFKTCRSAFSARRTSRPIAAEVQKT